jgi:hypothetical protein
MKILNCLNLLFVLFSSFFCTIFANAYNKPNWPLEVISWNLCRAYPGVMHDSRISVIGGEYPYSFKLLNGPSGLKLDSITGAITWLAPTIPSTGNQVSVEIKDKAGNTKTHNFSIDVKTASFYFVSPSGADNISTNNGAIDKPWKTPAFARTSANVDTNIIYLRTGTYNITTLALNSSSTPLIWMAYPGEKVILDCGKGQAFSLSLNSNQKSLFQGLEITNSGATMFYLMGNTCNVIIRKNNIHKGDPNTGPGAGNNPCFIFSEDGTAKPAQGTLQYDKIIIQENLFYDMPRAAVIAYNMSKLLFENNHCYNLSMAVMDKDDGYYNTYRANYIHDNSDFGLMFMNQYTQENCQANYNVIFNCPTAINVGWQPGYIKNIYVDHNTITGTGVNLRWVIAEDGSDNINIYKNTIIYNATQRAYSYENASVLSSGRVHIDSNLIYDTQPPAPNQYVSGSYSFTAWQAAGYDLGSLWGTNPNYNADHCLPATSPYYGNYGSNIISIAIATSIAFSQNPRSYQFGQTRNTQHLSAEFSNLKCYDIRGRQITRTNKTSRMIYVVLNTQNNKQIAQKEIHIQ